MKFLKMKSKDDYRKYVVKKRKELEFKEKKKLDKDIYYNLINSNYYDMAKNIFVYVSMDKEVDTHKFIKDSIKKGKKIFVPKVVSRDQGMEAVQIKGFEELKCGAYNILEPEKLDLTIDPNELDLVLLPGVAFDLGGGRIGYGGGFYDRFLKRLKRKIPLIALGYEFQIFEKVSIDSNDMLITGIITNKTIHNRL